MTETSRVEIERTENRYVGRRLLGSGRANPLPEVRLGPDEPIDLGGGSIELGEVVDALVRFDQPFLAKNLAARGQLALGQHLFEQLFPEGSPVPTQADLRIVSRDEHIARLPWSLLARDGVFLAANGWSVALSHSNGDHQDPEVELPPSPRILIAAPEPRSLPETGAEAHLEKLIRQLSDADHYFLRGQHLRVATSWTDFKTLARELEPHAVYYYGHGIGDREGSKLIFAQGHGTRHDVPLADFAQALRRQGDGAPPVLVYVNACQGDAGGLLGAGMQLGNFVPAVVTNRTAAAITAAQAQAMEFWRSVLLEGVPPHRAVARMHNQLGKLDLSFDDARWMTPVLHAHYDTWKSTPPPPIDRKIHDPRWHLKLDRVSQFAHVAYESQNMLDEKKPQCWMFGWYGARGQGVDLFHERLKVELEDKLKDTKLVELRLLWPEELVERHRSFSDMIYHAARVHELDALPSRIRNEARTREGRRILVLFRHQPLHSGHTISLSDVALYCQWLDHNVVPRLERAGIFALVGISWFADKPKKLQALLDRKLGDLELHGSLWETLPELQPLNSEDLKRFLRTHSILLPREREHRILEEILTETGGHYIRTLDRLKDLVSRAWDLGAEGEPSAAERPEDESF